MLLLTFKHSPSALGIPHVSWTKRLLIFLPVIALISAGYLWTNHTHLFEPRLLPLTPVDRAIPFVLWTVWPYLFLADGMLLPLFLSDKRLFRQAVVAIISGCSINLLFFLFLPTMLPRQPVTGGDGWSLAVYHWMCLLDSPANCFPSNHITGPAIGFFFLARQRPPWRLALTILFFLLSSTILTTKQHYLWDLLGGLATAALGIWVAATGEARHEIAC